MSEAWDKENWTSFPGPWRHFYVRNPKAKRTRLWKTLYHNWVGWGGGGRGAGLARLDNIRRWWYQKKNRTDLKETKKRTRWGWKGYPFLTSTKNRWGNQTGDRLGKGFQKIKEGPKSFSQSPELNHPQPPITTNPPPLPPPYNTFLKR